MATFRRVVEIATGEEKNLFRTVRVDFVGVPSDGDLAAEFADVIDSFRARYETQVRFVDQRPEQNLPGYTEQIPGEGNWDWGDDDFEEID